MVERLEDLNLPTAVVARLIKEALPPHATISKEARSAIGRAASVFVIYLTASSTTLAQKDNHKTVTSKNILDALDMLEFESFVKPLTDELENYRKLIKEKKDGKKQKKDAQQQSTNESLSPESTKETPVKSPADNNPGTSSQVSKSPEKKAPSS